MKFNAEERRNREKSLCVKKYLKIYARVLSCRENALLLSTILRYQGVPSGVRARWVKYVSSDQSRYGDHWISEVWLKDENRWILVGKVAKLLKNSDGHLEQLRSLQATHKELQGLKSAWPFFAQSVYKL